MDVLMYQVGVSGFWMGGALSFAAAVTHGTDLISAAVPFYGIPDQSKFKLEEIKIPVQAHFGKEDTVKGFSSPSVCVLRLNLQQNYVNK